MNNVVLDSDSYREVTLLEKTEVPKLPSFVDNRWETFADFFRKKERKYFKAGPMPLFPRGACDIYCSDLELLLAKDYNGKRKDGKVVLDIQGKEAALFKRVTNRLEEKEGIHHYLELKFEDEEWIVDPTWKQFAGKMDRHGSYSKKDPFNQRLSHEFPDILVAKRSDVFALMQALGREAKSRTIEESSRYWAESHREDASN